MSRPLRLGSVTALLVGLLAALPVWLGGQWLAGETRLQAQQELQRTADTLALVLAGEAASAAVAPVPPQRLQSLARAASLQRLSLHDAAGRLLQQVHADARAGAAAPQAAAGAVLRAEAPLQSGTLRIERDGDRLDADIARLERRAALAALATLLLALLVVRLATARTARALGAATRLAAQPLRDGVPRRLPENRGPREIRRLYRTLNALVLQLADERTARLDREARLQGLLDATLDAAVLLDERGRVSDFNAAAERTFGYLRAEVLGKPLSEEILPLQHRSAQGAQAQRGGADGDGRPAARPPEYLAQRADGSRIPVQLSLATLHAEVGHYQCAVLRDLGEQRRQSEERERILRSYKKLSARLERLKLALDEHAIVCITNARGQITYANRKLAELTGYARHEFLGRTHGILQSGLQDPAIYEDLWRTVSRGGVWHGELADRRRDGSLYWVACTIVPMGAGEPEGQRYVSVQTDITAQKKAEIALAEARRSELETGSHIQKTLLLGELRPQTGGWWISTHSEPSLGIDGDFYDVLHLNEHCIDLLIADVMGKGVPAALVGAATKMQFSRSIAELVSRHGGGAQPPTPGQIVSAVHQAMTPNLQALGSFVTLCYLRLDLRRRQLTYVGCGHEETLLLRHDGRIEALPNQHPPLGILDREDYAESSVPLHGGDAVFLSSDGVVDLVNPAGERWGCARMRATLQRIVAEQPGVATCLQLMRREMRDFEAGAAHSDDVTMLLLRVPQAADAGACARMEFERDTARLQQLRGFVADAAQACCLAAADIAALSLAVVEAATNVIRHAVSPLPDAPIEVLVSRRDAHCVVELGYLGEPFDPDEAAEPDFSGRSEGGFGLYIMRRSCDRVEYRHHGGVSTIALHKRVAAAAGLPSRRDEEFAIPPSTGP